MPEDAYLKLTLRERVELLDEISRRRNLAPAILEKDYWVSPHLLLLHDWPTPPAHIRLTYPRQPEGEILHALFKPPKSCAIRTAALSLTTLLLPEEY